MFGRERRREDPYVVEPVRWSDLQSVLRLAWRTTQPLYPAPFFEAIARTQPDYFRVVRESATGKVRGFVIAARTPGLRDRMLLLAVEPSLVGHGLRARLLSAVQQALRREGVRRFDVGVPASAQELVDFYRREGFVVVGLEPAATGTSPGRAVLSKALG